MNNENGIKIKLALLAFVLFSITLFGLFWLATTPTQAVTLALSFAAGLSMIFLPCTLPLVFVIIPLSMGKGYHKGLLMALMFGLGLTITLSLYGVAVALIGKWLGMDKATRFMFALAGVVAYVFGLSQLRLIKFTLPEVFGITSSVQKHSQYVKSFLMGLLLGNAGVGCPNPAFYVLLAVIAAKANIFYGGWMGFVHGLGRATPLIFISILAILGINTMGWVQKKARSIESIMGWVLLGFGVFLFAQGFFGMFWWESSPIHIGWNNFVASFAPNLAETEAAAQFFGIEVKPSILERLWAPIPWAVMGLFLLLPIIWNHYKKKILGGTAQ